MWEALKYGLGEGLAVIIVCVAGSVLLFVFNRAGFHSRRSAVLRLLSFLLVLAIACAGIVAIYTVHDSPFVLSILANEGKIQDVEIAEAPISLELHDGRVVNGVLTFSDEKSRKYAGVLPRDLPQGAFRLTLSPAAGLLGFNMGRGGPYCIRPFLSRWLVLTGEDFLIAPLFLIGAVLTWHGGIRGQAPPKIDPDTL